MKKIDDKGFTLIELIVTIVILGLVLSIGGYSIIRVMNSAKETDYDLLIENIKAAAEVYYQECKYAKSKASACVMIGDTFVDGQITSKDVTKLRQYVNGSPVADEYDFAIADVNKDGVITSDDAELISSYILGDESSYVGTFPDMSKVSLGTLVKYGYLKGNASNGNNEDLGIVNPKDNSDISECQISIKYNTSSEKIEVSFVGNNSESCSLEY